MIGMMKATAGRSRNTRREHRAQHEHVLRMQKVVGFAIVASGLAVIAAQALQHALQHALGG
ncbi:MAG TPA: hypothetical protein VF573_17140 [Paraburkholderia sp.]|uniref:hypothetical protein n=1 Tax=Paraburkholderia sp. TaxID=1926495 RepID=UPI002ED21F34